MATLFSDVRVGWMFVLNGNRYIKKSSRTARLLEVNRTFYVGRDEVCFL